MESDIAKKLTALRELIASLRRVVVAYSGGVDSGLVLQTAGQVLDGDALGVLALSPSMPESEKDAALALASGLGVAVETITTREVEDPAYRENAPNRCFFCKDHVYAALREFAAARGFNQVLDGMNAEDSLDLRPGRAAASKHGVRSPLHELGFSKADVRAAARSLGLPNWNKPAAACLSSRIPYGTEVTAELLRRIEMAEEHLRSLGFREMRARHHGPLLRLEVPAAEMERALQWRDCITSDLHALGWTYVTLDLDGLRHGSMNEILGPQRERSVASPNAVPV